MNIRPTVEFDDKYQNTKAKIFECLDAVNALTPQQRERLIQEILEVSGMQTIVEAFMRYINNGGIGNAH